MSAQTKFIEILGANAHNLKNCSLRIPRQSITVVTGVSGSGKSSLVFDTILAEAQRRYFHTLSHYSRQFLDIAAKPEVKKIHGLSPAIGLAQNETEGSKRASVATMTDLSELIGLCFANHGSRLCPNHKLPTSHVSAEDMMGNLLAQNRGELIALCAPIAEEKKAQFSSKLSALSEKGYLRVLVNKDILSLSPVPQLDKNKKNTLKLVVDYVRLEEKNQARLQRGIALALEEGQGRLETYVAKNDGSLILDRSNRFSSQGGCPTCQHSWPDLDARYFAANSLGRCKKCNGLGQIVPLDDIDQQDELAMESLEFSCLDCQGSGIDSRYENVTLGEHSVQSVHNMTLGEQDLFWQTMQKNEARLGPGFLRTVEEILKKTERLRRIGLSYLQLSRRIRTLSGGELQRLKLANILSESLRGVIYILDEPSQGLHPHELKDILKVFRKLKALGNTIIVVDHDEYLIRHADQIIDMGPGGGKQGGEVTAVFRPDQLADVYQSSTTARSLLEQSSRKQHKSTTKKGAGDEAANFIFFQGIKLRFLNISELKIKKNALNVVCGVSGAGKSSLVHAICYRILKASLSHQDRHSIIVDPGADGTCQKLSGLDGVESIHLISRKPLAKSSTSMPATYCDIFTYLRQIYERLPEAQISGLRSRDFSLHVSGGRCEACKGRGEITLSMKFLADAKVSCTECYGQRYQTTVLNIKYLGLSISEVLELTIDEAIDKFINHPKIVKRLRPASELGLGYLRLGQSSSSLSGGEAQRLKLVPFFSKRIEPGQILVLDEPTQGLHLSDIELLMNTLDKFVAGKGTILMIEHAHEVISRADWVIDIGPGSGKNGGRLVFQGDTSELTTAKHSQTASYFKEWVNYQPKNPIGC